MNKLNKLFAGFAAVAMLAACSNDEPNVPTTPENPADGEVAYMAITITAPEAGSRTTEDGGYVESDLVEKEHSVNSVDFYFFNSDGAYAFNAKADDTSFVPADGNGTNAGNGNVEYIGSKNILILNGVRQNNYPEYVVTVLNKPADFAPGQTLQETADKLATFANDFKAEREKPFVMTTSSFLGTQNGANGAARHDAQYFATKLNTTDFKLTVADAQATDKPVEIYVERLAAKVEVAMGGTTETIGGVKYYKLTGNTTLGGGNNQTEGGDAISDVKLYVKVLGWRLNATADQSYMSKKLDTAWETGLWNGWNVPGDWRSFWAKAYTYGANPEGKLTYETPATIATKGLGFDAQDQGNIQYCYENTNNPKNIFSAVDGGSFLLDGAKVGVENAKVTHVVLHTQVYQKVTGEDGTVSMVAPSLVQYRGVLFTEDSYKAMLLNQLKAAGDLNFWHYVGETANPGTDITTSNWESIGADDLVMEGDRDKKLGQIKIVAKALENGEKIYKRVETPMPAEGVEGEEGYKPAYTKVEYVDITDTYIDTLNGLIADLEAANPAVGSDTAETFYFIPVEHLAAKPGETNAVEGYYGVVRNHWYKITVNSFKKVGHLVFDPDKDTTTPIKPDGPEDPLYYVGAKINILSWKVVNQTVTDL